MKQKLSISIIFTFLLLSIDPCAQGQKKNQPVQESKSIQGTFKWTTITLPTTVSRLISEYGNYTKFIPCTQEEDCDFGSIYEWKISNGLIIDAWAQEVSGPNVKASKQHKIESYELASKNNSVINDLVFQLSLNKSSLTECKKKFNPKKSTFDNTWKFKQNDVYTYLYFNNNAILIKIGQHLFDRDESG